MSETIIARSTPPGRSAVAVLRISGSRALEIARRLCGIEDFYGGFEPWKLHLRRIVSPRDGGELDRALVVVMPAPRSYTGEDMAEIHCHGSSLIVNSIMEAALESGARAAQPGEFTRRAFLNGKLDLAQAEAVCDLVSARCEMSRRAALEQLDGRLSQEIGEIREVLLGAAARLEARLDFPEDTAGDPEVAVERVARELNAAQARLERLIKSSGRGLALKEGLRVPLVGRTNTGKSSLFNTFLRTERAIVTAHPGTTRDTIEAEVEMGGAPVILVDTAGIRREAGEIEQMGIERTRREIVRAQVVLFLLDGSEPIRQEDCETFASLEKLRGERPVIGVKTKADLPAAWGEDDAAKWFGGLDLFSVSTVNLERMERLEEALVEAGFGGMAGLEEAEETPMVTNLRHVGELRVAAAGCREAAVRLAEGVSEEFAAPDLYEAIDALGKILGLQVENDILEKIFSNFCIGK